MKARLLVVSVLAACAAPSAGGAAAAAPARLDALLAAPAERWAEAIVATLPITAAEADILAARVLAAPNAPGGPAAVAVLGACGHAAGDDALAQLVVDRGALATDAALALGDRRSASAAPTLRVAMMDAAADPGLRTAAACALVQLGDAAAAQPFLRAILLAGTPDGLEGARTHALPARTRWAHERYLVQRLVLRAGDREFAYDLDPDASWPRLRELADRLDAWLRARAGR